MTTLSRRALLRQGTLCFAALGSQELLAADPTAKPLVRVGLLTDLHYGDKEPKINRYYRETLAKLDECVELMNKERPDCVVELGDFIDQAETVEEEAAWLDTIESHYAKLEVPRHYILGNHCVATLTKDEFVSHTKMAPDCRSAFQINGVTFLLLDACFRHDGVPYGRKNSDWRDSFIPAEEAQWIRDELAKADGPVVVLTHQRLDASKVHAVRNAPEIRAILEASGKVSAVFQGHSHKNDLQEIAAIPYCTLPAMIEGSGEEHNSYAMLEVLPDSSLRLHGYRQQISREFSKA